ncbi:MAG: hypothetical protein KZQ76_07315 [Candidatus Thiodiazotropha sp. (ex Epidulcina cf. delphinae)]|nr:hypothetical protein [Candidatus Thiodiazotropha sp. (ex Epidulcina cf. delphinae)]
MIFFSIYSARVLKVFSAVPVICVVAFPGKAMLGRRSLQLQEFVGEDSTMASAWGITILKESPRKGMVRDIMLFFQLLVLTNEYAGNACPLTLRGESLPVNGGVLFVQRMH